MIIFEGMLPIVSTLVSHGDNSDNIAIISEGQEISYRTLTQKIFSAASRLIELGVAQGDRVVLSASNTPSFIFGYFATHLIGAIAVPLDPQTPARRLEYVLDNVTPKMIFSGDTKINKKINCYSIDELNRNVSKNRTENVSRLDGIADILFTTGTIGEPKGVALTHANISTAAININSFIRNNSGDREVVPLPLSHSFGLGRLRCIMLAGGTIILNRGFTFPGEIFQQFENWKATGISFVPAGLAILFRVTGPKIGEYSEQLRYIEIGSAPMPLEHKKLLMDLLPKTRICMHYGLTEASRSSFIEFHESSDRLDSIGKASPNVELRIVDEKYKDLPPNKKGRILVKGGMVMKEYWGNDDLTRASFNDGWFYTGDIGHKDDQGYLYLDGRENELINVGGLKVSPVEIESILNQHESIDGCACVGIPDPNGITGEAVKAFLVLKSNAKGIPSCADLQTYLKGKIEPYKIPMAYEWIEKIPATPSGKIQRNILKNFTAR